eukprot:TRINITY_DN64768_c0_g1_i1.p1 TRINITY_DN64768_c0_g1~~TRINITY_DN64768_c0_g1_i1.p1  ORF type:complete len:610 (-),score=67.78 TRINITY_DN64768_c0_g1_i1:79-1824(-)
MSCSNIGVLLILNLAFTLGYRLSNDPALAVDAADPTIEFPELCDPDIVAQTCHLMNGADGNSTDYKYMSSSQIGSSLSADAREVMEFWDDLNLTKEIKDEVDSGYRISCEQLCQSIVGYLSKNAILPPSCDKACYRNRDSVKCDVDVRPEVLKQLGPTGDRDLPDLHDTNIKNHLGTHLNPLNVGEEEVANKTDEELMEEEEVTEKTEHDIEYRRWEVVKRVAALFRIYPARPPAEEDKEQAASLAELDMNQNSSWSGWRDDVARVTVQADAYVTKAIRHFRNKETGEQVERWFGRAARRDVKTRKYILYVLNGILHMLAHTRFVYPGESCTPQTFAYVYPRGSRAKLGGKYVIHLCELYMRRKSEQVETIVHEGSHHATAFTKDVCSDPRDLAEGSCRAGPNAYGRPLCKTVARSMPERALINADNYCYYVQDVQGEVSESSTNQNMFNFFDIPSRFFGTTTTTTTTTTTQRKLQHGEKCFGFGHADRCDKDLECVRFVGSREAMCTCVNREFINGKCVPFVPDGARCCHNARTNEYYWFQDFNLDRHPWLPFRKVCPEMNGDKWQHEKDALCDQDRKFY